MKKITILLLSLSAAFCCKAQTLVAHYDFNGVSGTSGSVIPDVSPNGLNGTLVGTGVPTATTLQLSNTGYVHVPGNVMLDLTRWTIKVNLTFNSFNPGSCQVTEIIKHGSPGGSDFYGLQMDDNNYDVVVGGASGAAAACTTISQQQCFGLAAGAGPSWFSYPAVAGPSFYYIQAGVQYCITATYGTDDSLRVYINGVQWYSKHWGNPYSYSFSPDLYIGGSGGYFDGTIDDVEIYDGAVTPGQITGGGCSIVINNSNCSDTCYWKVTGNNIIGGNNIFGTLTNDNINIWTNSTSRAIYTRDGNFDFGAANTLAATSTRSTALGQSNSITNSANSNAVGSNNSIINSSHSVANGSNNSISSGQGDLAAGQFNNLTTAGGTINTSNSSLGQDNFIGNSLASGIIGIANVILNGKGSFTAGEANNVSGINNTVLGRGNTTTGSDVHVYGQGLTNGLSSSVAMGFNGNRTMAVTQRGVAIQWNPAPNTPPAYNLEVDAGGIFPQSNISFHNLPTTSNSYPIVVTDPVTGELFRGSSTPPPSYNANQGVTLTGNTFMLGYQCGTTQTSKFTVDREIALDNHNLNFNSNDQGKLYMGNQSCKTLATRLEISSNGLVPTPVNSYTPTNAPSPSGLRFTNLTAQSQQLTNPGTGVLSLDPDGDVIWVRDQTSGATAFNGATVSSSTGSIQFGQDCGTSGGALINDRELPMADYRIFFSDGPTATPYGNRVVIGSSCTPSPSAKLEVVRNQEAGAGYDVANKAFAATNLDLSPVEATGVYGEANNLQNISNVGGDFLGKDGHNNTYGVRGLAQSQGLNAYGGWFEACGASVQNWGVYGSVCNPRKGIDYAGYFNGDVTATGIVTWSDENIKKNIKPIDNALNIISKLNPRQYEFDNSKYPSLNVSSSSINYGVIAQELEQVLPTLVSKVGVPKTDGQKGAGNESIKGVNYIELIPILIQAVKDQQTQIEASKTEVTNLKSENETLKAQLAKFDEKFAMLEASITNICESGCPGLNKTETAVKTPANESKDQLFQSIPNPTDNKAIINYFLARNYENATIVIANMEGKTIRNITLDPKSGNGSITIELGEYAAQTYVYSLYVNRQIVDSKKMTVIR